MYGARGNAEEQQGNKIIYIPTRKCGQRRPSAEAPIGGPAAARDTQGVQSLDY